MITTTLYYTEFSRKSFSIFPDFFKLLPCQAKYIAPFHILLILGQENQTTNYPEDSSALCKIAHKPFIYNNLHEI